MKIRSDKDILVAAALSVGVHAAILAIAALVTIGGTALFRPPENVPQRVHVQIASDKPLKRLTVARAGAAGAVTGVPGYGGPAADTLATGIDDPTGKGIEREEEFTELLVREKMEETRALPDTRAADRVQEAVTRRPVRGDVVSDAPGSLPVPPEAEVDMLPEEADIPKEFATEMPAFTPVSAGAVVDTVSYKPLRGAGGHGAQGGGSGGGSGYDQHLVADLVVYRDPADGRKYFRITIMAGKDADRFAVMPKEVTFLIDSSLSIQSDIAAFKKGLAYCLDHLGPADRFNVAKFDQGVRLLDRASLAVSPESLARAKAFIDRILPANTTDISGAVSRALAEPPAMRPSYVVLISDGRATAGLRKGREIIARSVAANADGKNVFAFSGAGRTNRYLLDFLAFCNRGWAEYGGDRQTIDNELSAFYDKIKDPVILSPRYRFSGVDAAEVYPKALSDFFRGVSFVIVGRYEADDEFSMQLVGEGADETVEFIFADSFKAAREGTREIARAWAYNKIYHLIAQMAERGTDPALIAEIEALSAKFDIRTPYAEGMK